MTARVPPGGPSADKDYEPTQPLNTPPESEAGILARGSLLGGILLIIVGVLLGGLNVL
jgi:hypothetical protein